MKNFENIKLYLDKRMKRIFLFGFISGFPWVLIGSALSLWLKENDLSRTTIGWAGLIFGVYAINFLWAPLIDRLKIPYWSQEILDYTNAKYYSFFLANLEQLRSKR